MDPIPFVDLKTQIRVLREESDAALARVIDDNAFVLGPDVQAFEEAVRKGYLPYNPADRASVPQSDGSEGSVGVRGNDAASEAMDEEQAARFLSAACELERDGPHAALGLAGRRASRV